MNLMKRSASKGRLLVPLAIAALALAACGGAAASSSEAGSGEVAADVGSSAATVATGNQPYLVFNQRWLEGLRSDVLDLDNVDEIFSYIFSELPDEVIVYPTENYYYFKLYVDSKQLWGNIRLAAGRRERGVLSFAYFEFKESPYVTEPRLVRNKFFTDADGLRIEELDKFTFKVSFDGKDVIFNLNQISQEPPALFDLADHEEYIEKTYDESGYNFILLFNNERNYFNWVLNEEVPLPVRFLSLGERSAVAAGRQDRKHAGECRGIDQSSSESRQRHSNQSVENR